jgi:hypothetical protein
MIFLIKVCLFTLGRIAILVPQLLLEDDRFSPQTLHFGINFIYKLSSIFCSLNFYFQLNFVYVLRGTL